MPRTDEELLAAHRRGDDRAFAELVTRHTRLLWHIAAQVLPDPQDAADAVQDALVAAHRHAGSYRGEASVRSWLVRILVNGCIDRIRADRVRAAPGRGSVDPIGPRPDIATELATRLSVRDALATIPAEQRAAVLLVDAHDWTVADAADALGVPVGTVKSRCSRARSRLAVLLGHLREEVR